MEKPLETPRNLSGTSQEEDRRKTGGMETIPQEPLRSLSGRLQGEALRDCSGTSQHHLSITSASPQHHLQLPTGSPQDHLSITYS
jgi:hypothetical protein